MPPQALMATRGLSWCENTLLLRFFLGNRYPHTAYAAAFWTCLHLVTTHMVSGASTYSESLAPLYTILHSCLPKLSPDLFGCFSTFWLRPRADFCVLTHQVVSNSGKIFVFMEESSWYFLHNSSLGKSEKPNCIY